MTRDLHQELKRDDDTRRKKPREGREEKGEDADTTKHPHPQPLASSSISSV